METIRNQVIQQVRQVSAALLIFQAQTRKVEILWWSVAQLGSVILSQKRLLSMVEGETGEGREVKGVVKEDAKDKDAKDKENEEREREEEKKEKNHGEEEEKQKEEIANGQRKAQKVLKEALRQTVEVDRMLRRKLMDMGMGEMAREVYEEKVDMEELAIQSVMAQWKMQSEEEEGKRGGRGGGGGERGKGKGGKEEKGKKEKEIGSPQMLAIEVTMETSSLISSTSSIPDNCTPSLPPPPSSPHPPLLGAAAAAAAAAQTAISHITSTTATATATAIPIDVSEVELDLETEVATQVMLPLTPFSRKPRINHSFPPRSASVVLKLTAAVPYAAVPYDNELEAARERGNHVVVGKSEEGEEWEREREREKGRERSKRSSNAEGKDEDSQVTSGNRDHMKERGRQARSNKQSPGIAYRGWSLRRHLKSLAKKEDDASGED